MIIGHQFGVYRVVLLLLSCFVVGEMMVLLLLHSLTLIGWDILDDGDGRAIVISRDLVCR